jgi:hypothetical protein
MASVHRLLLNNRNVFASKLDEDLILLPVRAFMLSSRSTENCAFLPVSFILVKLFL